MIGLTLALFITQQIYDKIDKSTTRKMRYAVRKQIIVFSVT